MPWIPYLVLFGGIVYLVWRTSSRKAGGSPAPSVFNFGRSRARVVAEGESRTTFADVAGVEEAKEELVEIIDFLKRPEKYQRLGARIPRGVLLVGPPGTGKTLLARAVAGEADVPFISINGSEFVEMLVGVGAARVRDLFCQASRSSPCIVFIDELDALGRSRSVAGAGGNDEREQTLNQMLVEMDGFAAQESVIVMAATNRPEVLDPALLRPGRFDRQVLVDVPDRRGRRAILDVHARGVPVGQDVDLDMLASRTPGFAGADLANLVNEAALLSARRGLDEVDARSFSDAIDRVVAGLEKKNRILAPEERRRVAYHESGHALAGALAGGKDIIHKISIVPRGMAALGFIMQMPSEERYLTTKKDLLARLVGLLGGRAAEEIVFGDPSTGAQNDLQKATDVARAMVVEYGMSDAVGPVTVSRRQPLFLTSKDGGALGLPREVGEDLADTIDREVRRIVEGALGHARQLLEGNRDSLDELSAHLIEEEVLEGEELTRLIERARAANREETPERRMV